MVPQLIADLLVRAYVCEKPGYVVVYEDDCSAHMGAHERRPLLGLLFEDDAQNRSRELDMVLVQHDLYKRSALTVPNSGPRSP
jgi:hypothetical protein